MAQHEIIHLPFGRLATIERQRTARGKCERVAFLDALPLRVARATEMSAPLAIVAVGPDERFVDGWRAHGGRLYRPLWGNSGVGCTPAEAEKQLRQRAEVELENMGTNRYHQGGEILYDNAILRKAASGQRGMGPEGYHPVRRTVDDGRESQAVAVADAAERLLMIGGRLYHEAPLPGWQIATTLVNAQDKATQLDEPSVRISATAWRPHHRPRHGAEVSSSDVRPWLAFGPEEGDEAGAVAEAVVAALGRDLLGSARPKLRYRGRGEDYVIKDRAAYLSTLPAGGADAWVGRVGGAFLAAAAGVVGHMPTTAVETYLEARRAVDDVAGAGGHEAAFAAVRAVADLVKASVPFDGRTFLDRVLLAAHVVPLRYDLFERHRVPDATDEADLDMHSLFALSRP